MVPALKGLVSEEHGGFYDTPIDHEKLITRPRTSSTTPLLLGVAEWRAGQPKEIAVTGPVDDETFRALRHTVGEAFLPHRVLVAGLASADLPLMHDRPPDRVLAYVCQAYMCLEPTADPARLRELLGTAVT